MSTPQAGAAERLAEMRAEFDAAFSRAHEPAGTQLEDLLAIGVGARRYALRLRDIAGLHTGLPLVALPGSPAALAGVAGLRGGPVAVFDLRVLLGESADGACRWLVLATADPSVGFAFDAFERHVQVPAGALAADRAGQPAPARQTVRLGAQTTPLVDLAALLDTVKTGA